ncbi:MAG: alpha/beta hydrolase [Bacteroidales bacterium]
MRTYILLLSLIVNCISLVAQNSKGDLPLNDINYRTKAIDDYASSMCKLDIYIPSNATNFPTIIWFHGGGLTGGRREIPERLKNKGYAVVGVGYRLSPKTNTPNIIEDAAAATAWVFKNISKYGGDSTKIIVSGHSAGGYLTLMIGYDKSYLSKHNIDANNIAALIPYSPQVITHFTNRKERGIGELQPIIDKYAPLYHLRAEAPPTLLITGDREEELFGRYEENAYLWRMLKLTGHKRVVLKELEGFNHGDMVHPGHDLAIKYSNGVLGTSK